MIDWGWIGGGRLPRAFLQGKLNRLLPVAPEETHNDSFSWAMEDQEFGQLSRSGYGFAAQLNYYVLGVQASSISR